MKLGELFIELGTKGGDKAAKDVTSLRVGLSDAKSMALETKAAILGLLYELGNLSRQSMAMGQGLTQFGNLTGLNPQALQQWQYALQQSGVSADETAASIKHLQDVTTDIIVNGNIPNGFKVIAESVKLDPARLRDTFYVLDKFREYARAHRDNPDITRSLLAPTMGNDKVIQALMSGTFDPSKTPGSQIYSKGQAGALNQDRIALTNLSTEWEHFLGKLTAKHGMPIIQELAVLTRALESVIGSIDKFNTKFQVTSDIGKGLKDLWEMITQPSQITGGAIPAGALDKIKNGLAEQFNLKKILLPSGTRGVPGISQSITNNINTQVTGAEPVKPHEIDHHLNKAVDRAARAIKTPQQN